jgi:uncharacterized Zn finger protein (UPF0148 family)
MPVLEHRGNCVALWIHAPHQGTIACPGCHRRYVATPERQFAAAFEQILERHMRRLADEGAAMLSDERDG